MDRILKVEQSDHNIERFVSFDNSSNLEYLGQLKSLMLLASTFSQTEIVYKEIKV